MRETIILRTHRQPRSGLRGLVLIAGGLLLAVAAGAAPKDHPSLVNPEKTDCSNCHAELMSNPVVHAAAKDGCLQCHEFSKQEKKTLVAPVAVGIELCTMCHSELAGAAAGKVAAPHYPVTDSCTGCHNPHSTKEPKLVISPLPALCLTCHDAATIDPAHGKSVSRGDCRSCHLPHGGPNAKLLRAANQHAPFADKTCQSCHKRGGVGRGDKGSAKVCFACHTDQQEAFGKGVIHTVVKQGKCEGCHDPHLSDQQPLQAMFTVTKLNRPSGSSQSSV